MFSLTASAWSGSPGNVETDVDRRKTRDPRVFEHAARHDRALHRVSETPLSRASQAWRTRVLEDLDRWSLRAPSS